MIYADYDFYITQYLGTVIPQEAFASSAMRASRFLDYYTRNKVKDHTDLDDVKMACCALAEEYHCISVARSTLLEAATKEGEMQSQTVGSYSVTYRSKADTAQTLHGVAESINSRLAAVARQHLANTGLLYRGGGGVCTHPTR